MNMIGNGVATLVVARWEKELTSETLQTNLGWSQMQLQIER